MTTWQPRLAKAFAISRPSPLDPPVTSTTFPDQFVIPVISPDCDCRQQLHSTGVKRVTVHCTSKSVPQHKSLIAFRVTILAVEFGLDQHFRSRRRTEAAGHSRKNRNPGGSFRTVRAPSRSIHVRRLRGVTPSRSHSRDLTFADFNVHFARLPATDCDIHVVTEGAMIGPFLLGRGEIGARDRRWRGLARSIARPGCRPGRARHLTQRRVPGSEDAISVARPDGPDPCCGESSSWSAIAMRETSGARCERAGTFSRPGACLVNDVSAKDRQRLSSLRRMNLQLLVAWRGQPYIRLTVWQEGVRLEANRCPAGAGVASGSADGFCHPSSGSRRNASHIRWPRNRSWRIQGMYVTQLIICGLLASFPPRHVPQGPSAGQSGAAPQPRRRRPQRPPPFPSRSRRRSWIPRPAQWPRPSGSPARRRTAAPTTPSNLPPATVPPTTSPPANSRPAGQPAADVRSPAAGQPPPSAST